ncbi:sigma-54-dependent transcriptional regulator [Geomesophilobacter sediminis]|uniref:Sigma-54-dependent Fis family transcriptional regulator n=1 Tax=Geomesophilobacter sediminis TaxID=2798584 RepID=A0A8J7LVL1_9BACT|nr:sigma-54 dependent transcriptional regulator [Geomesophilobacter sediminis]MBJ6725654.1 sigma-54-dependent Fis family transcriptional regulator [Geomesophilobacter sediminis]
MIIADPGRVLIVDDEPQILKSYTATLKLSGVKQVVAESDSRRTLEHLAGGAVDVVILDLFMPQPNGMELLPELRERFPQVPVVVVTAAYEPERVVECMKLGAFDYLVKPVENERLLTVLRQAFEWKAMMAQVHDLRDHLVQDRLDHPEAFSDLVTRSRKMRSLFQYLEVLARSPQPVLITGESGTGKELVARALHRLVGSPGELVAINVAGLDDAMFSDALFGHKRSAFTGADQPREGLIARAAGGLLFLDEIGDLGELSQVKLLRLLQESEYYPIGADTPRRSEARIVCATNRDLKKLVAAGKFRNDLYYRLNVHHVALPPLRERKEDIPLLLEHFIARTAEGLGTPPPSYPQELLELLATYHFPGNIRELQGMVSDAVARCQGRMISQAPFRAGMTTGHPPAVLATVPAGNDAAAQRLVEEIWGHFPTLREAEDLLVRLALKTANGNQGTAATMLGLKRQTFNVRLKVKKSKGSKIP